VEPLASKEGFQMQEQFGAKDPRVKILSFGLRILSLGHPKMGKRPQSKNFEFWPPTFEFAAPKNGQMFFPFKKRITDRISHAAGSSVFLNIINTQHNA
jgi:hypothetical protein